MKTLIRQLLPSVIIILLWGAWHAPQTVRLLPLVYTDVQEAGRKSLEQLRQQGLWLVNVAPYDIQRNETEICYTWHHRYRGRAHVGERETLTTCS